MLIAGLLRRDPLPAVGAIVFAVGLALVMYVLERRFPVLRTRVPGHARLKLGPARLTIPLGAIIIVALSCVLLLLVYWRLYAA